MNFLACNFLQHATFPDSINPSNTTKFLQQTIFLNFFLALRNEIRFDISCESSAGRMMIHMICEASLPKDIAKLLPVAVVIGAVKVTSACWVIFHAFIVIC